MKKFTILGERCSGTNYLESLITKNFDVKVTWEYGWKHFFGFNDLANSDDTLFIGIVRDPHTWMNSLWREKHHLQPGLRSNIKSYLNEEFWSYYDAIKHKSTGLYGKERMEDRNIYTGQRYENIFEMRKTKLKYLIEDMPNKVKNYILIRYEDLISNFEETINKIKDTGLQVRNDIEYPVNVLTYKGNMSTKPFKHNLNFLISKKAIFEHPSFDPYYERMLHYDVIIKQCI